MGLTVCCTSTDVDLATTGALRSLVLGATATSTSHDRLFSDLIRRASRWAETYVGAPLTLQSYSETLPGFGTRSVMASRTPIRALDRVMYGTDSGSASVLDTSSVRVEDSEAGLISRDWGFQWTPLMEGQSFDASVPLSLTPVGGQEYKPYVVDYRAGYVYGGLDPSSPNWSTEKGSTSTGRTLPEDVEEAVLLKAHELYSGGAEVASEKLGDLEVNYRSLGTDKDGRLVTRSRELLEPYRRVV